MPNSRSRPFVLAVLFASLLFFGWGARPARAQLPATHLGGIVPLSGSPGSTIEARISGTDLDGASKLVFSNPGITATQKMAEPGPFDEGPQPVEGEFTITIAGNVQPGRYEARVEGKYGLSNPRTFHVSAVPPTVEIEPNSNSEEATLVELPANVNGLLETPADTDYFQFVAAANGRVILDAYAHRADSSADLVVTVYDATGREVASSRDGQRNDPLVDLSIQAGQRYFIRVRDAAYRGGPSYPYRFTLGALPHIDYVFPPAGEAGGNRSFTVYGRNLPGGQNAGLTIDGRPIEKATVNVALPANPQAASEMHVDSASGGVDGIAYRIQGPGGWSNAVLIGVATAKPVLEKEPNSQPEQAQAVTLPCEIMGQFLPERDQDWYQFEAKEGEKLSVEVISDRLGLDTNPNVLIQQAMPAAEGETQPTWKQVAFISESEVPDSGPEFTTRTGDPAHVFEAPADGTYRVLVRDSKNALRADPRHVYRLVIRPAQPDYRLAAVPVGSSSAFSIRPGGREGIRIIAFRRDGFDGEIRVTASGLPNGVTASEVVIGPARGAATMILTAAANAPRATTQVSLVGKSEVDGRAVERPASFAAATQFVAMVTNNQPQPASPARFADSILLSVVDSEPAPAAIAVGEGQVWETSRGGTLKIPYARQGGFKGKFTLNARDLPANVAAPVLTINPNQANGEYTLQLRADTPVGTYTVHFAGNAEQVDFARNPEAAAEAAERKKEVDQIAAKAAADAKAATEAKAAADKAAADAATAVTQSEQTVTQAKTKVEQSTATRDAAKTALDAAKKKVAASPEDQAAKTAVTTAEKTLTDAEAALKAAMEEVAAAEKALEETRAVAEKAVEAQQKATADAEQATELAALATQLKQEADKRATDTANAAKPKKVNVPVYSTPVTLKITPSPVVLQPFPQKLTVKQGEKLEVPVKSERKYGYTAAVTLQAQLPQGVGGLSIPNSQIAANQTEAKWTISAAANATPGTHLVTVRYTARPNNQNVVTEDSFELTVEEVKPPAE